MKTLIFNGSPRINGDTASLIQTFTEHLEGEYKIISAYRNNIKACTDCRYCWTQEGCCIKDDMQEVYDFLEDCDHVVIASPIYFAELTGPMLCVGSRLQMYFCRQFMQKKEIGIKEKEGAVFLVGGGNGRADRAYSTAKILLHDIRVTGEIPCILSHDTDHLRAAEDQDAKEAVIQLAKKWNAEAGKHREEYE